MAVRLLQINLNHACQAQHLMMQCLAERGCAMAIVAEPYQIPDNPSWIADTRGSAAIVKTDADSPPLKPIERGVGYVAAQWGSIRVIACYAPPSWPLEEFDSLLERVGVIVNDILDDTPECPLIVAGDFNAKSPAWGESHINARGRSLVGWVSQLGLCVLNTGRVSTCSRPQGQSIVDIAMGSRKVVNMGCSWRVVEDIRGESLSDHKYIEIVLGNARQQISRPHCGGGDRRWALTKLDGEKLEAALLAASWSMTEGEAGRDIHKEVEWLRGEMQRICDASMPRVTKSRPKKATYWWTEELAELRRSSVHARRRLSRLPRIGHDEEREAALADYRSARSNLSRAIRKSRARCWDELLASLNEDPWGRPYKIVMNKYRTWTLPVTESLDTPVLNEIVDTLFPQGAEGSTLEWGPGYDGPHDISEDLEISSAELARAVRRIGSRKAPGPDGIPGKIWVHALDFLGERLRCLYNRCLRQGVFPREWKKAKLVLLPKAGREAGTPQAYRPICLLDEVGKLFERILASRLVQHLSRNRNLHEEQYGFREGRSTVDAIQRVRSLAEASIKDGGVALAVSLDIANAFNTLPWDRVGDALQHHGVPRYLVGVIREYFRDRSLEFIAHDGLRHLRSVCCGVPQGSVLGPLLWNLAYDRILYLPLPRGCHSICYADDTLVVATGADWGDTLARAEMAVARVVRGITDMGLKVAAQKTESVFFYGKSSGQPPPVHIGVGGTSVLVGDRIKYLGLLLDGRWSFGLHFEALAPKVERVSTALARLLPNLGGPDGRIRRIYMGTVNSVALYGSPVWAADLAVMRHAKDKLRRVQRCMAARVVRAYRTVSHAAATVLAGWPPLEFLAQMYADVYWRERELRGGAGRKLPARAKKAIRLHARRSLMERWDAHLSDPHTMGQRTVGAIRPCLQEWADRAQGEVTFRLAQVLTGHGCFGEYLCRIRREDTTQCHHCQEGRDSAQHTLAECQAWSVLRRDLCNEVGDDLSLPVLVQRMLGSERSWKAVVSFCETVMLQKEAAERVRRQEAAAYAAAAALAAATNSGEEDTGEEVEDSGGDDTSPPPSPTPSPRRLRLRPCGQHRRGGTRSSPPRRRR